MKILELLKVIFLGIVEGITEWLPISSTGHMILVDEFIKLDVSEAFMNMFLVVIQLGAIMAVVVLYFNKLWPLKCDKTVQKPLIHDPKDKLKLTLVYLWEKYIIDDKFILWLKIAFACLPAMVVGLLFDDFIEATFNNWFVVAFTLVLYGVLFIVIENSNYGKKARVNDLAKLNYRMALGIGLFQVLAVIPGTSRSGATILGGLLIGASRTVATEFTFFLAIPVMFGASLLKVLKYGFAFTSLELTYLAVGMGVAFVLSIISIKFLLGYIKKNDFKAFGYYRIALGLLVFVFFTVANIF